MHKDQIVKKDPYKLLSDAVKEYEQSYKNSKNILEDFNALFFGSPRGRRVFAQIMEWSGFHKTAIVKGDPYMTHVREGEKNIAARIWGACVHTPPNRVTKTVRKE